MRKPIFTIVTMLLSVIGVYGQHIPKCGDDDNAKTLRAQNPEVYDAAKIAFESQWNEHIKANMAFNKKAKSNPKIIIPVVFHVLHQGEAYGTGANIDDSKCISALAQVNSDFSKLGSDVNQIDPLFAPLYEDANLRFVLAQK
jgi:hypothetical protein